MRTSFRQTAIVTTALIGLTAFAAVAAPPGASDPMAGQGSAAMHGHSAIHAKSQPVHSMQGMIEQRITDMHARLQITPEQQPEWNAFAQVMRDNARGTDQRFQQRVQTMSAMTATENMQSYAQLATEHAQDMQKLVPVFQALYASMSDHQKASADQMFRDRANRSEHPRHG